MLDLTKEELQTLYGVMITEYQEIKELLDTVGEADKKELLQELERVNSIINKINPQLPLLSINLLFIKA